MNNVTTVSTEKKSFLPEINEESVYKALGIASAVIMAIGFVTLFVCGVRAQMQLENGPGMEIGLAAISLGIGGAWFCLKKWGNARIGREGAGKWLDLILMVIGALAFGASAYLHSDVFRYIGFGVGAFGFGKIFMESRK